MPARKPAARIAILDNETPPAPANSFASKILPLTLVDDGISPANVA